MSRRARKGEKRGSKSRVRVTFGDRPKKGGILEVDIDVEN